MGYAIIGIVIVMAIAVGVMIFLKSKENTSAIVTERGEKGEEKEEAQPISAESNLQELVIQLEMLPVEDIPDENKLVEITDSKVLAHVDNLIPGLFQVAENVKQAIQTNGEVLYKAIIPAGEKLASSKDMEGAVRGFYPGANGGIGGHANLVPAKSQKVTAANTAAAVMGVASLIVGQYYMTQINAELGEISDEISKIIDFLDNEYRSRVFSLVAHVKEIADFQVEIVENNELRLSKISQLARLQEECAQLLGQANLALTGYTKKNDLDYATYEKELPEVQKWYMYQKALLDVLSTISELRYTLQMGAESRESCTDVLSTYTNQVSETRNLLTGWHETTVDRLGIDTSEVRRKRVGFDGVVHFLPSLFNDNQKFRPIKERTARMIETQSAGVAHKYDTSDLYAKDVQLISKGDKLYYLPPED